jgi:CPA1 family monovalent cation:H+ antiporter
MDQFVQVETLIIELLLIVSLVAILVQRLRIPYTVALIVAGLFITTQSALNIDLSPELILTLFVPPLVFEAAFHLNFAELRRNFSWIFLLAVPGVILTMLIVGGILAWIAGFALPIALLFGALISATDPVAVVALFRTLNVPKRLSVLMEGESLMNDGTAIVIFNMMTLVVVTGSFNLFQGTVDFIRVAAGGVVIGLVLGWLVSRLIALVDDYLIETTLTTILAFGSYLVADRLAFSGVLAVVAAGLVNGNIGPKGMSPTTRIVLFNFWEYVAFLANSLVFLMIGLDIDLRALVSEWQLILLAFLAVLLARLVIVYGLGWIANHLAEPIPRRWSAVLSWGGLRGAISLALALSLPASIGPIRDELRLMAFGVALLTLLIQAMSMRPFVRLLRIVVRSDVQSEYELRHARLASLRAAEAYLDRMHNQGLLTLSAWEKLKADTQQRVGILMDRMREILITEPALVEAEISTASHELLRIQRGALMELRRDGVISEESFEKLNAEVDFSLQESEQSGDLPEAARSPARFLEVTVPKDSRAVGIRVALLNLPPETVLVSIRRGKQTIIPRGDTTLQPGDFVMALCRPENLGLVRESLTAPAGGSLKEYQTARRVRKTPERRKKKPR